MLETPFDTLLTNKVYQWLYLSLKCSEGTDSLTIAAR
jgi:hypothetical protein